MAEDCVELGEHSAVSTVIVLYPLNLTGLHITSTQDLYINTKEKEKGRKLFVIDLPVAASIVKGGGSSPVAALIHCFR